MQRRYSRSTCWVCSTSILRFSFFKHEKDSRRVWKASKSKKTTQTWTFIEEFWDVFLLVAKDRAETGPATPAYAPTGTDLFGVFNEWKRWRMADLDMFALGKTFQEIVCEKGGALTEPFKEDFWSIQEKLLHPNQDLQQAGFGLSGQPWMWNPTSPTSSQRNHTFSSSSHNTNLTNHIHLTHQAIAILHWWDDTAHHCCSVNLLGLGMTHIACLPPDPTVHVAWS